MADWRTISDTEVDPDAPVTSELAYAFRDNVIAAFEGASGAPRLADAALPTNSGSATASGRTWVAYRMALAGAANIGSYIMARKFSGAAAFLGDTVPGSQLSASSANGSIVSALSGSWMCMGRTESNEGPGSVTMWLRVS